MSGDQTQQEQRPRDHRMHGRQTGGKKEAEGSSNYRNRGRRSGGGSGRKGVYRFEDQLEHDICQRMTHRMPEDFPVINRSDLATRSPAEVARTETRILFCDCMHDGPHIWPNGDESATTSVATAIVVETIDR